MKLRIRAKAADDLEAIHAWIAQDNTGAAAEMVTRIRRRIARLASPGFAYLGRPGLVEGTRELVEAPYIIVYEVSEARDEVAVLAIFHGAQSR